MSRGDSDYCSFGQCPRVIHVEVSSKESLNIEQNPTSSLTSWRSKVLICRCAARSVTRRSVPCRCLPEGIRVELFLTTYANTPLYLQASIHPFNLAPRMSEMQDDVKRILSHMRLVLSKDDELQAQIITRVEAIMAIRSWSERQG